jgi:hypothetical protein
MWTSCIDASGHTQRVHVLFVAIGHMGRNAVKEEKEGVVGEEEEQVA